MSSLSVGSNGGLSLLFLKEWCDSLAMECYSGVCLVTDKDGQRVYGLFHQMTEKEHNNFEAKLADLGLWAAQCIAGNLSTGKYNVQSCSNVYSNHHSALLLQFPLI